MKILTYQDRSPFNKKAIVPKSINWHFAQIGEPYFFVDLRQASSNPIVSKWLDTPSSFAAGYWIHRIANENFYTGTLKGLYQLQ